MDTFEPWVKYPPLKRDRLSEIADIIRNARQGAFGLHEPSQGDTPWSLGCRMYSRTCHALKLAGERLHWLTILSETQALRFTFAIGSVPVRFYKGPADETPLHYQETTYAEFNQQQLALELEGLPCLDRVVRIAVETDSGGEVSQISLVELDEAGTLTGLYRIPIAESGSNILPLQAKPVTLPPLAIQLKTQKSEGQKAVESKEVNAV